MNQQEIAAQIPRFEGLIFKTASMIEPFVEFDVEDIRQRLRIKVWYGLESYDRRRVTGKKRSDPRALEKYVFSCVANEKKDILKAKRHNYSYIADYATDGEGASSTNRQDAFELRYLSATDEQTFARVEAERLDLPATLTQLEREVIVLLYDGWMQTEIRGQLNLSVRAISDLVASIREKMADWRPSASEREAGPTPPLPRRLDERAPARPQRSSPPVIAAINAGSDLSIASCRSLRTSSA